VDAGGNLYISDSMNHRVRRILPNGTIVTVAGNGLPGFSGEGAAATSASLHRPEAVACDTAGNLYIADRLNYRVRKVLPNGTIVTIAGQWQLWLQQWYQRRDFCFSRRFRSSS
jgi:hypothetical protein